MNDASRYHEPELVARLEALIPNPGPTATGTTHRRYSVDHYRRLISSKLGLRNSMSRLRAVQRLNTYARKPLHHLPADVLERITRKNLISIFYHDQTVSADDLQAFTVLAKSFAAIICGLPEVTPVKWFGDKSLWDLYQNVDDSYPSFATLMTGVFRHYRYEIVPSRVVANVLRAANARIGHKRFALDEWIDILDGCGDDVFLFRKCLFQLRQCYRRIYITKDELAAPPTREELASLGMEEMPNLTTRRHLRACPTPSTELM